MKVAIIGGGASGMMAAIVAAQSGHEVTVFEHMQRIGKKLLVTGSGKCNLTNEDMSTSHFFGTDRHVIESVLSSFSYDDTIDMFNELGLLTYSRNGYIYPQSDQASSVLDVLRFKMSALSISVVTDAHVKSVSKVKDSFIVKTDGTDFSCERVIIATGSMAAPKTGSDGSGYSLAESFGHTIIKPLPALTQLRCDESFFKGLAGIRVKGKITLFINQKAVADNRGELQLNAYGLSGIPTMIVSHLATRALDENKQVSAHISFLPDHTKKSAKEFLEARRDNNAYYDAGDFLLGILHKNLSALIVKLAGIPRDIKAGEITDNQLDKVATLMTDFCVNIVGFNSFDDAQVCSGGIDLNEVTDNLESKICPGLFFAGEILDVNGDCGGYNLQWAWSSGAVSGRLISK